MRKAIERETNGYSIEKDNVILNEIREYLNGLPYSELQKLLLNLDSYRIDEDRLRVLEGKLLGFRNDSNDLFQDYLSLTSLLIQEVNNRIKQNDERKEEIIKKRCRV
ncbi:hypothetical protein MXZ32_08305 [Streptococcus uberis]|nr:hypothetical protein [Streptococcus uberis]MCK1197069.1 hypothetical protein [Streptococcus uberis]